MICIFEQHHSLTVFCFNQLYTWVKMSQWSQLTANGGNAAGFYAYPLRLATTFSNMAAESTTNIKKKLVRYFNQSNNFKNELTMFTP
jgi:hypothetical protein